MMKKQEWSKKHRERDALLSFEVGSRAWAERIDAEEEKTKRLMRRVLGRVLMVAEWSDDHCSKSAGNGMVVGQGS